MKRIVSLLLILVMCVSFVGAGRPQAASAEVTLASLKRDGTEVTSADSLNLYDVVTYGQYPQGANGQSADIEWIVVGFDGENRVKLLSRYCLDTCPFNSDVPKVSWTSTTLYSWLNTAFKAAAFSSEEQERVSYISIPTVQEARDLPLSWRRCFSTPYAISQGADPVSCIWWLSDQGKRIERTDKDGDKHYYFCASVVNGRGEIMPGGYQANYAGKAVRPLIILDLNTDRPSSPLQRRGAAVRTASDLALYDTVTFGTYSQTANGDPIQIEWIVAGVEGDKVKLISLYGLDSKRYNETHTMITWQTSTLYAWLNDGFMAAAFSAAERDLLTGDVTLPNVSDARALPRAYQSCTATAYAIANGVGKKNCIWWLSDPTRAVTVNGNVLWCASAVQESCEINEAAYKITLSLKAVRPMIEVDLSKLN